MSSWSGMNSPSPDMEVSDPSKMGELCIPVAAVLAQSQYYEG